MRRSSQEGKGTETSLGTGESVHKGTGHTCEYGSKKIPSDRLEFHSQACWLSDLGLSLRVCLCEMRLTFHLPE